MEVYASTGAADASAPAAESDPELPPCLRYSPAQSSSNLSVNLNGWIIRTVT